MRALVSLIAVALAAFCASCAQENVTGPARHTESTSLVTPSVPKPEVSEKTPKQALNLTTPWSAIGRINRQNGGFCTGVLIAPDRVLTTAHCLWDARLGSWTAPSDLHFLDGYHLKNYIAHRRGAAIELPSGIEMTQRGVPRKTVNDWAILVLKREINSVQPVSPMELSNRIKVSSLPVLFRIGYERARPYVTESIRCKAERVIFRSFLLHDCGGDKDRGGFPLLVKSEDGWHVIGLEVEAKNETRGARHLGLAVVIGAQIWHQKVIRADARSWRVVSAATRNF